LQYETTKNMKRLAERITKGGCKVDRHPEIDFSSRGVYRISTSTIPTREELIANAELIAEAFNVTNETGKSPRELADENKELKYWKDQHYPIQ
jgi:hypothetical protein